MNITSVGEVEVRDDYDGTITLANNFTINNNVDNLQALCKSCHIVKTKNFLMK